MQRAGSETLLKTDLEQSKEAIKIEIRKQLKLKEGAENLKKVATDKKTLAQCNTILKEATAKLQDLYDELQDLRDRSFITSQEGGGGTIFEKGWFWGVSFENVQSVSEEGRNFKTQDWHYML